MFELKNIFDEKETGDKPLLIAGPCSAESEEQVISVATELSKLGINYFRAGIWKPRTKPGGFEGIGSRGLPWLKKIKKELGLVPITEVATPVHLDLALKYDIESFWIGARTATNPFAVQDIADRIKILPDHLKDKMTVLVKNPVNPDLELWIGALERIYKSGIRRLGAIHRGFSAYGEHYYRNRPEWSIPLELKHRIPQLPLICDPSHIAGRRDLIAPLSQEALDLDFDGLMIEVHCCPDKALSDGEQQINIEELKSILRNLTYKKADAKSDDLKIYRAKIDTIDNEIMSLLSKRMDVSRQIGEIKRKLNLPVWQSDRYKELMLRHLYECEDKGLSENFIKKILSDIHEESVRIQLLTR